MGKNNLPTDGFDKNKKIKYERINKRVTNATREKRPVP